MDGVRHALTLWESAPSSERERLLQLVEASVKADHAGMTLWFMRQFTLTLRRGDEGPLRAFAVCVEIPEMAAGAADWARKMEEFAYVILRWRGKDPTTVQPLPRPAGAPPTDEWRAQGKVLLRTGLSYRDAVIGLWWMFAPYTVGELRALARQASGIGTENGARKWLESQGRRLLRSLDRAWRDVGGSEARPPGLTGFLALTGKSLIEWPDEALEAIVSGPRLRRTRR